MSALAAFHAAFAAEVAGDDAPLASFLSDEGPGLRVYRNNVVAAMASALASNFPAVRRLVGEDFFRAAAAAYFKASPPRTRTLVGYGKHFPDLIETLPSAARTPYLGDIARLDRAWLEAHIAGEGAALTASDLAQAGQEGLANVRVALHPSARLVRTRWRVHEVWRANRADDADARVPRVLEPGGETVLLWRCDGEVQNRLLTFAEAKFFDVLTPSAPLGAAVDAVADSADASAIFAGALASGLLVREDGEEA